MTEEWCAIPGYGGIYEASTEGRIRCWVRFDNGVTISLAAPRIMPQYEGGHKRDYWLVSLKRGDGFKSVRVHRLILLTFVGPPPENMEGAHEDGDGKNNRLDNLKWKTPEDNQADRKRHGTKSEGENHGRAKLTTADVYRIKILKGLIAGPRLAKQYGVHHRSIYRIWNGRAWNCLRNPTND